MGKKNQDWIQGLTYSETVSRYLQLRSSSSHEHNSSISGKNCLRAFGLVFYVKRLESVNKFPCLLKHILIL